jgi:hypothetical protein
MTRVGSQGHKKKCIIIVTLQMAVVVMKLSLLLVDNIYARWQLL